MNRRGIRKPSAALVVACVALFAALGGGAYAASKLEANSVKSKQIRDGSLKGIDIKDDALTGADVDETTLDASKIATFSGGLPGGQAGGDLTGNYPNPLIRDGVVTAAKVAAGAIDSSKIKDDSVESADIKDDTIEGQDVAEETLATVPQADLLHDQRIGAFVAENAPGDDVAGLSFDLDPSLGMQIDCSQSDLAEIRVVTDDDGWTIAGTFNRIGGSIQAAPAFDDDIGAGVIAYQANTTQSGTGSFTLYNQETQFGQYLVITVDYMAQLNTVDDTCNLSGIAIERYKNTGFD